MLHLNKFNLKTCLEQEVIVDGDFKLPFDDDLLMSLVNYNAAKDDDEINDMDNPKKMVVRITVSTKEL